MAGYLDDLMEDSKTENSEEKKETEKEIEKVIKKAKEVEEENIEIKEAGEIDIKGAKSQIVSYGIVKIFKVEGEPLLVYSVPVVKPAGPEKAILSTIKEAATRLITVSPEEIRDATQRRNFYFRRVKEIIEHSPELGVPKSKVDFYADMVVREMIGYGILDVLTQDDLLEEIMVIGPEKPVYIFHRQYGMMKTNIMFGNDTEIRNLVDRIARQINRRVDMQNPLLDARLPDGSRVNATVKPISLGGSTLTIRKFKEDPFSVVDLIESNTLTTEVAAFLWVAVDGMGAKPANILISGGTGSGKTTTLNVLAAFIPDRERIISIEDTAELNLPLEHWIRFETRPPGLEGTGEITMDVIIKNSLRMRPDRVIVGEVRHAEAFTLFTAMNTGHDGCMGTVHANSAAETLTRVMNPPMNVPPIMIGALNFIIVQSRIHDPRKGTIRRVTEIAEVTGVSEDKPHVQILYEWDPALDTLKATGIPSMYEQELVRYTGLPKEGIRAEIDKRRKFLEMLIKKDVRSMKDVVIELKKFRVGDK
ncbi:CpaF family protein [Candidatus Micrarchaeota archaeon]|nr:CpaF family protein [Candidatus Micrarchaeota archaeon]